MGKKRHQRETNDDEGPKSFQRMMANRDRAALAVTKPKAQRPKSATKLQIRRGESMSEFSRRVNEAVPLPRARGVDSRKLQKYSSKQRTKADNLRKEYDSRLRKRRGSDASDEAQQTAADSKDDEDVWAFLKQRDTKPKFGEVADRPPELPQLKQKSSVPKSAGSIARREILEKERQRVLDFLKKKREE